ncbi:uncharacterized protein LOC129566974 [Sitodiplosis mosellana]|uniref:uncharacterized protein LOC129566974 n=1 Tax=Sitodiplosis mosellana TaxID=263140 RepID=UPI002443F9B7|nr:uncharacterized protein LOC129566974 [Sitodiplosis mosellana]
MRSLSRSEKQCVKALLWPGLTSTATGLLKSLSGLTGTLTGGSSPVAGLSTTLSGLTSSLGNTAGSSPLSLLGGSGSPLSAVTGLLGAGSSNPVSGLVNELTTTVGTPLNGLTSALNLGQTTQTAGGSGGGLVGGLIGGLPKTLGNVVTATASTVNAVVSGVVAAVKALLSSISCGLTDIILEEALDTVQAILGQDFSQLTGTLVFDVQELECLVRNATKAFTFVTCTTVLSLTPLFASLANSLNSLGTVLQSNALGLFEVLGLSVITALGYAVAEIVNCITNAVDAIMAGVRTITSNTCQILFAISSIINHLLRNLADDILDLVFLLVNFPGILGEIPLISIVTSEMQCLTKFLNVGVPKLLMLLGQLLASVGKNILDPVSTALTCIGGVVTNALEILAILTRIGAVCNLIPVINILFNGAAATFAYVSTQFTSSVTSLTG